MKRQRLLWYYSWVVWTINFLPYLFNLVLYAFYMTTWVATKKYLFQGRYIPYLPKPYPKKI